MYLPAMVVVASTPRVGSEQGGTRLRLHGEHFVNTLALRCRFGTHFLAPAIWISPTEVRCTVPPMPPTPEGIAVTVLAWGIEAAESHTTFLVRPALDLVSASPAFSPTGERTTPPVVRIRGHPFPGDLLLLCRFESGDTRAETVATVVDSLTLDCPVPSRDASGQVKLMVAVAASPEFVSNALAFEYVAVSTVGHMFPLQGPSSGGTTVTFTLSSSEANNSTLQCRFGAALVPATTLHSPASYSCTVHPQQSGGAAVVELDVVMAYGEEMPIPLHGGTRHFQYYTLLEIQRLEPNSGPAKGGTQLTVVMDEVATLLPPQLLHCRFAPSIGPPRLAPARRLSHAETRCQVPVSPSSFSPHVAVDVVLVLADGAVLPYSRNALPFTYRPEIFVSSVVIEAVRNWNAIVASPSPYNVDGQPRHMRVRGAHFDPTQTVCGLGAAEATRILAPADFVSAEEIVCALSHNTVRGPWAVSTNGGHDWLPIPEALVSFAPFSFDRKDELGQLLQTEDGHVLTYLPRADVVAMEAAPNTHSARPSFSSVLACSVSSAFLYQECETISLHAAHDNATAAARKRALIWTMRHHHAPVVHALSPAMAPSASGLELTLHGTNFTNGPRLVCTLSHEGGRFTLIPGLFSTASEIRCRLPKKLPPQLVRVYVSNDGLHFGWSPRTLTVVGEASVLGMSPGRGPVTGGTHVRITGKGFRPLPALVCRFGDGGGDGHMTAAATLVSPHEVACVAPPAMTAAAVHVHVSNDNVTFSAPLADVRFSYDPVVQIRGMSPAYGDGAAAQPVVLRGDQFLNVSTLACRVCRGEAVPATFRSAQELACLLPERPRPTAAAEPVACDVDVTLNGQDWVASGPAVRYTYHPPLAITAVWPSLGSAAFGGTAVSVWGSGFVPDARLSCRFGSLVMPAHYLNATALVCPSPPSPSGPGTVALAVSNNGASYSTNNATFTYVFDASVDRVLPSRGPARGGFPVLVMGSQFLNSSALACVFGGGKVQVPAVFVNASALTCVAPDRFAPGLFQTPVSAAVRVQVTNNGLDVTPSFVRMDFYLRCQEGYYCPDLQPLPCPPGSSCPGDTTATPRPCGPGTFQPLPGQSACRPCPAGFVCPALGMIIPNPCPAGYVCDSEGLVDTVTRCPAGHYCEAGTHTLVPAGLVDTVTRCPFGFYCLAGAVTDVPDLGNFATPQPCFAGFFCPAGSIGPEGLGGCPTGYYCPARTTEIVPCPAGYFCPGVGNLAPRECPPGTFGNHVAQSACAPCPRGYVCPDYRMRAPELCPAGFVCGTPGLSVPLTPCPHGYWCAPGTDTADVHDDLTADHRPWPCPEGTFCLDGMATNTTLEWVARPDAALGAVSPQPCHAGAYCQGATHASSGIGACFPGHYCPAGVPWPLPTPPGTYANSTGATVPLLCVPGMYAPRPGMVTCAPCPGGHSCPEYGTIAPVVCPRGTYRGENDTAVACQLCPIGTFSPFEGVADVSLCLRCPAGRVCGTAGLTNVSWSVPCAAGYVCGVGTHLSSMFDHPCPAGYYCHNSTVPERQYDHQCPRGFYCPRGTPAELATQHPCPVGYYCPAGSARGDSPDTRCPRLTITPPGAWSLRQCKLLPVAVCDREGANPVDPWDDPPVFDTLQDYGRWAGPAAENNMTVDGTYDDDEGRDVQVVAKVLPFVGDSGKAVAHAYANDTVEVQRTCPTFGFVPTAPDDEVTVTVIGRHFRPAPTASCRFRVCMDSTWGLCLNPDGSLSVARDVEARAVPAVVHSATRLTCHIPTALLPASSTAALGWTSLSGGTCVRVGDVLTYERFADGHRTADLVVACTAQDTRHGHCSDRPGPGLMLNPCHVIHVLVEVSNDGTKYSGEGLVLAADGTALSPPSYAVYSHVIKPAAAADPDLNTLHNATQGALCLHARPEEQHTPRTREEGWHRLTAMQRATLTVDLRHVPESFRHGTHWRLGVFVRPSHCATKACINKTAAAWTAAEAATCPQPVDLPLMHQDTGYRAGSRFNVSVWALDDVLLKVEMHLLHGLYLSHAGLLRNTTHLHVIRPTRAFVTEGLTSPTQLHTRRLSPHVSWEEAAVPVEYFFAAVYFYSDRKTASPPLNLPPPDERVGKGPVLVGVDANAAGKARQRPDQTYWRRLHNGTVVEKEAPVVMPYLPFVSQCQGFDAYIPLYALTEDSTTCSLPPVDEQEYPADWERRKWPAFPALADVTPVTPWTVGRAPVADVCHRQLACRYDETLVSREAVPRWMELETGAVAFRLLKDPLAFIQYASKKRTGNNDDMTWVEALVEAQGVDAAMVPVVVDRTAAGALPGGCSYLCYPRRVTLELGYHQRTPRRKRLVHAALVFEAFDKNATRPDYTFALRYVALSYWDMYVHFAFSEGVFFVFSLVVGLLLVTGAASFWGLVRILSPLRHPPRLRAWRTMALRLWPAATGLALGLLPPVLVLVGVDLFLQRAAGMVGSPVDTHEGGPLDRWALRWYDLFVDPTRVEAGRQGRLGFALAVIGLVSVIRTLQALMVGSTVEAKRGGDHTDTPPPKTIEAWRRSNALLTSLGMCVLCMALLEFSYFPRFGQYTWTAVLVLKGLEPVVDCVLADQLRDELLKAPLMAVYGLTQAVTALHANTILEYVLLHVLGLGMLCVMRMYVDPNRQELWELHVDTREKLRRGLKKVLPMLWRNRVAPAEAMIPGTSEETSSHRRRCRHHTGSHTAPAPRSPVQAAILRYLTTSSVDLVVQLYLPLLLAVFAWFHDDVVLPQRYGLEARHVPYYLLFAVVAAGCQPLAESFVQNAVEQFHGWKLHEYLAQAQERFQHRSVRWMGHDRTRRATRQDEASALERLGFSSQYYFVLTLCTNGLFFVVLGLEMMLQGAYNAWADPALVVVLVLVACMARFVEWLCVWVAQYLVGLWEPKASSIHPLNDEASARRGDGDDEEEDEAFQHAFLEHNRTWLINQLPRLLTPHALRTERDELLHQLNVVLDKAHRSAHRRFGPVQLPPRAQDVLRVWLRQARQRARLLAVVQPLIERAQAMHCHVDAHHPGPLQVELLLPFDTMLALFAEETQGRGTEDAWKAFWAKRQRYTTLCSPCLPVHRQQQARLTPAAHALLRRWHDEARRRLRHHFAGLEKGTAGLGSDETMTMTEATQAIARGWLGLARRRMGGGR